jgi:hypothetical protein
MKLRAKRGVKCTQATFSMRKKLRHRDTIYGSFAEVTLRTENEVRRLLIHETDIHYH